MKENELRVGNWVRYDGRCFKIHSISLEMPILDTDEFGIGVVSWRNIEPIPLTPEILEAAGWYWNKEADCYENYDVRMSMKLNYVSGWMMYNYVIRAIINNRIFYLHQLQNLYFALCGEELEIDINKIK